MLDTKGLIKKVNLTFTAKFISLLVPYCLSPMVVDNIHTWDRAVLVATLVARLEVDFAMLLISFIH